MAYRPPRQKAISQAEALTMLRDKIIAMRPQLLRREFEPTGLQEDIIMAVGKGEHRIVLAIDANRVGKTTVGAQIAKNIIWPCDQKWFAFWEGVSVFKEWPYQTKRFRIMGTPTNLADNGPIQQAIAQWWPADKFSRDKGGKHYYSSFTCDSGWSGDVLTYEQSPTEYEGQTLSFQWSDEPPPHKLVGAINSRMAEGGIWLITMTPWECGIFLDVIDDLLDRGYKVIKLSGTYYENDINTGKPNHLDTKRGLWTKQQIDEYVAGIPLEQRDARIFGRASNRSGKVYPMFDQSVHVRPFDWADLRTSNCYMAIDPHGKYYPFLKWYAVRPDGAVWVYNEFPTVDFLGGSYYDEIRTMRQWTMTVDELAQIITSFDLEDKGSRISARAMDPRFAAANPQYVQELEAALTRITRGKGCCHFQLPPCERIESQRVVLQEMMTYNPQRPVDEYNQPSYFVSNLCKNSARAADRHYWEERVVGKQNDSKESEEFKDPMDCDRYLLGICGGKPEYKPEVRSVRAEVKPQSVTKMFMPRNIFFQQTVSM